MTAVTEPPALTHPPAVSGPPADDASSEPTSGRSVPRWLRWAVIGAILTVGLVIRYQFVDVTTMDYSNFISRWYSTLDEQGFSAFKTKFADYNYPYLYLLWMLTVAHIPSLIGAKALSVAFDVVLAFFAYRIVALRSPSFWIRALAFGLIFLLPSVIANSSYWGQADAIYSACALGGVYFLLRSDPITRGNAIWACVFFGLAISFKLQAVFVVPILLWLLVRRAIPWYSLLAIPAVFVALEVPAIVAGAPVSTALSVYLNQTDSYKSLTLGAANLYQLIPISGDVSWLAHLGIAAAATVILAFLGWSVYKRPPVTRETILVVATASAVIVPFLLPSMHERYFYTAEILTVVLAFYLPMRYWIIPILVQAAAIGVYHSSLSGEQGHGGMPGQGGGYRPQGGPGGATPPQGGQGQAGWGHGAGGPGGPGGQGGGQGGHSGGMPGSTSGYSSGRGDAVLSVYAAFMAAAALGMVATVVSRLRAAWPDRRRERH